MIASSITGSNQPDPLWQVGGQSFAPYVVSEIIASTSQSGTEKSSQTENVKKSRNEMTVEEYVKGYFSDIPIMIEIAKCESRFRQHFPNGNVLRGEENPLDKGVMQINEYYHGEDANRLGYDIKTLEGNTAYARFLFEKYGVKPWMSSSSCWNKTIAYSEYKELAMKNK